MGPSLLNGADDVADYARPGEQLGQQPCLLADLEDLMPDGLDSPKEDDLRADSRYEHPAVSHTESAIQRRDGTDRWLRSVVAALDGSRSGTPWSRRVKAVFV